MKHAKGATVLLLELTPPMDFEEAGFPVETTKLVLWLEGQPVAYPLNATSRIWRHRNQTRDLCLWYEEDPRPLTWEKGDGLTVFISIVHRHLLWEECARRTGEWPVEDAPHGRGDHPITQRATRKAVRRWGRR